MDFNFSENKDGLTVTRAYGLDSIVEIPEADFGDVVTGVGPYCFAQTQRGVESPAQLYGDDPVCGTALEAVFLPRSIKRIGAYAFYNCFNLRKLSLYSTTTDLGAGLFTGCTGIGDIDIYIVENTRSCFRELLMELNQPLRVNYFSVGGELLAELIFPAFYENSVENTPGRILMRDVHGCGIMYRNCFIDTEFQFRGYDHLFKEVDVYDGPELACELAVKRLLHPYHLLDDARAEYAGYLLSHAGEAAAFFDAEQLRCLTALPQMTADLLDRILERVLARGDQGLTAIVMNAKYEMEGTIDGRS